MGTNAPKCSIQHNCAIKSFLLDKYSTAEPKPLKDKVDPKLHFSLIIHFLKFKNSQNRDYKNLARSLVVTARLR
jgi:hypothetical protein